MNTVHMMCYFTDSAGGLVSGGNSVQMFDWTGVGATGPLFSMLAKWNHTRSRRYVRQCLKSEEHASISSQEMEIRQIRDPNTGADTII